MIQEKDLTIRDVAGLLKLAERTVYSLAQDGELPAFKIRDQWRGRRQDFDEWMETKSKLAAREMRP